MKKTLATVACALALIMALPVVGGNTKLGQVGVDVVTAATGDATPSTPTTPTTPTKPTTTTPPKTTTTTTKTTSTTTTAVQTTSQVKRLLAFGSVGEDVKFVQTKLNESGAKLKVDGIFGKLTLAAVKSFQAKNGLKVDGIVGPKTLAKLPQAKPVAAVTPVTPTKNIATHKGDLYIDKANYTLVATKVEGNIYFTTQEAKDTFKMDNDSSLTGSKILVQLDAVTTPSVVNTNAAFEKAISAQGTWIPAITQDLTFNKELVLEGEFKNTKTPPVTIRKIALYSQDEKRNVTRRFTLTAPKLTIKSPNANISKGIFKGDIYVTTPDFQLIDTRVEGNIYFTTQAAKDGFKMDATSVVTGRQILVEVDAVTTASIVNTNDAFEKAISKDGTWIPCITQDLTFNKELVLEGEFKNTKTPPVTIRKIALYSQDDKRNVTRRFTLTAPKLTIKSPNANISKGIFKGDIYVTTPDFQLIDTRVEGNIYFTTQAAKDGFKMDATSVVTGRQILVEVDAVTTASIVNTNDAFEKAISKNGTWIPSITQDLTFNKELVLEGEFKNTKTPPVTIRKIALYSQDDKRNVTRRFTLTAPKLTIKSPAANISKGIFVGDIYVTTTDFQLIDTKVIGNIYFATQAAKDGFKMDATSVVTGKQEVLK